MKWTAFTCVMIQKIIQDDSLDDALKIFIAFGAEFKELILICEGCYNSFSKTFEKEVFFEETKKCSIEIPTKKFVEVKLQIINLV